MPAPSGSGVSAGGAGVTAAAERRPSGGGGKRSEIVRQASCAGKEIGYTFGLAAIVITAQALPNGSTAAGILPRAQRVYQKENTMFQARPINLKTEVWERIDEYLNKKADEDRNFKPNRSLFLEEAAIAFLDAAENPPAEEEATSEEESFDFGSSDEETTSEESTEETTEESTEDEFNFDFDTETTDEESAEPAVMKAEAPEEEVVEEAPPPKKR